MAKVVHLTEIGAGIGQITMMDKDAKNTFSHNFIESIKECFNEVNQSDRYKVIILTGYDNYFACGGTKEELIKIYKGELKFNDLDFYRLVLDCKIPVISAMQGHALGGGFVFGLYADIIVIGKENIYTTNFMNYGFTPGMGATLIVPERLGASLGHELMFTANNYRGADLARRGVPFEVVPKKDVLETAKKLAISLAEKPMLSLVTLKEYLSRYIRKQLPKTVEEELKMHEITFKQDEVLDRIKSVYA